jgi:type IX secretion system PorP/SprF family membrane protein
MKKIVIAVVCIISCLPALAQQKPHYTQYILNQYILNPAITGIENYTDVKLSHRHQWVGVQDAPVTTYFTIHAPIGKKDTRTSPTSFRIPGVNPRGRNYWEEYSAASPHHGVGLQIINDRTGPLNRFAAYATYAYHLGLNATTNLAGGFGVGMTSLSIDASKLDFGNVSVDPAVYGNGVLNKIKPDLMAGIYVYSSDFFIGFSAQQVVPQKVSFNDNAIKTTEGKNVPHLFLTAGYRFMIGEDWNLIPSVMAKYVNPVPMQVDLNAKLQYLDLLWVGASFRTSEGFAGMAGINISNTFNVGYSYDYTTSRLSSYSKGTHEILIGFLIGNKYGDTCPRNVW